MKTHPLALTFGLSIFLAAGAAHADATETGRVTTIIVEGSDLISINLSGADVTTECSGGARWTINRSDDLFKEKYAAILSAAATGQEITLVHLSGSGCGDFSSNKIYYVQMNY